MTPQPQPTHTGLLYDDPGELVAAIPGLLTFHPADSVVLLTYTGFRRLDLESVLRLDIPAPEHIGEVCEQLRVVLRGHEATVVDLVVLGGDGADPPDRLPSRALVRRFTAELEEEEIGVAHAVWAPRIEPGATWWCYTDPACTGPVHDPRESAFTAAFAAAGAVTFGSREELAALLAPDPEPDLTRRAALIDAHPPSDPHAEFQFLKDTLDVVADRMQTHPEHPVPDLDDPTIARLATALSTPDVREACLAFSLTGRARPAELLWTRLTRATPKSARADPASLLGVTCYLYGDGARAGIALDVALEANPDHRLTQTLRHVLDFGVPPRQFRTILTESFIAAFANR
jgi:hypothetical protein